MADNESIRCTFCSELNQPDREFCLKCGHVFTSPGGEDVVAGVGSTGSDTVTVNPQEAVFSPLASGSAIPHGGDFVCTNCYVGFNHYGVMPRSFLGFGTLDCPKCRQAITYPLTDRYKTVYAVLLAVVGLFCVATIASGGFALPGAACVAMAIALRNNTIIGTTITHAWQEHERQGGPTFAVSPPSGDVITATGDALRWYHVLVAVMLPYFGLPWGIINMLMGRRKSGIWLIGISCILLLIIFAAIMAGPRR